MVKTQRWKRGGSTGEGAVPKTGSATEEVSQGGDTVLTEAPPDDETLTTSVPADPDAPDAPLRTSGRRRLRDRLPVLLMQAAHPRQAVLTAAASLRPRRSRGAPPVRSRWCSRPCSWGR